LFYKILDLTKTHKKITHYIKKFDIYLSKLQSENTNDKFYTVGKSSFTI